MIAAYLSANSGQTWAAAVIKQITLRLYGTEPSPTVLMYPLIPTPTMIVQSFISVGSVFVAVLAAALFVHARNRWAAFDWKRFLLLSCADGYRHGVVRAAEQLHPDALAFHLPQRNLRRSRWCLPPLSWRQRRRCR